MRLEAYDYHVFLDFREIWDDEFGTWGKLCHQLEGRGVASIDEEVKQIRYGALIDMLRTHLEKSRALLTDQFDGMPPDDLVAEKNKFALGQRVFLSTLAQAAGISIEEREPAPVLLTELGRLEETAQSDAPLLDGETARLLAFAWLILHRCGEPPTGEEAASASSELIARFGLARPLEEELCGEATGEEDRLARLDVPALMALFAVMVRWQRFMLFTPALQAEQLPDLLADRNAVRFLCIHTSGGHRWFIKERWELMLEWLELAALTTAAGDGLPSVSAATATARTHLLQAASKAGYCLDLLLKGCAG